MGIIDILRPKKVEVKTVEKEVVEKEPKEEFNLQVLPLSKVVTADVKTKEYVESNIEWVYRNVQVIAQGVSGIELELFRVKNNNDPEKVEKHELLELLTHVNDFMTFTQLTERTWTDLSLTGEAVWWLVRNNPNNPREKPTEIIPLMPGRLNIEPGDLSKGVFIDHYIYKVPGKEDVIFRPWELLHFKTVNPENIYRGKSTVQAAATTIDTDTFAADYNKNFFKNDATPSAILTTNQRLQPDTHKRLLKTWNAKFRGTGNANKLAILESGLEYQALQITQRDMQFLEQQKWTRDKIMAIFGNTPVMLGIVEDVNRANAEASEFVWLKHTIKPKMWNYVNFLNEFLVPIYADDLFLSFKDPIPANRELDLKETIGLVDKVMTINEARVKMGLDVIEGGDSLFRPFNVLPVGEERPEAPQKAYLEIKGKKFTGFKRDFSKELALIKNRNFRLNKKAKEFDKAMDGMIRSLIPAKPKKIDKKVKNKFVKDYSYDVKEHFWKQTIKVSETFEEQYENFMRREVYPRIERETIAAIKSQTTKGIKDFLFKKDPIIELTFLNFLPLAEKITGLQGTQALEFLDINEQFIITDAIRDRITSNSRKAAVSVTDTAFDRIKNSLADGIDAGEGQAKLIARTRKVVKELSKNQAELIALSEVSRATNLGILEAYKDSGIEQKEWFTALDERVCPWCMSMEGKILNTSGAYFDLGDSLTVKNDNGKDITLDFGFENIQAPPLHPRCRCTTVPFFGSKTSNDVIITKRETVVQEIDVEAIKKEVIAEAKKEAQKTAEIESTRQLDKFDDTLKKIDEVLDGQEEIGEDTRED